MTRGLRRESGSQLRRDSDSSDSSSISSGNHNISRQTDSDARGHNVLVKETSSSNVIFAAVFVYRFRIHLELLEIVFTPFEIHFFFLELNHIQMHLDEIQ